MAKIKQHSLGAGLHERMNAFHQANGAMKLDAAGNGKYEMDDATMHPAKPKTAKVVKALATPAQRLSLTKATAISAARRKGPLAG